MGGRTVAEARLNLSYNEVINWQLYRNKHGPLSPNHRLDMGIARLGSFIGNLATRKSSFKFEDFMPFGKSRKPEEPASIESVFGLLQSVARQNKSQSDPM